MSFQENIGSVLNSCLFGQRRKIYIKLCEHTYKVTCTLNAIYLSLNKTRPIEFSYNKKPGRTPESLHLQGIVHRTTVSWIWGPIEWKTSWISDKLNVRRYWIRGPLLNEMVIEYGHCYCYCYWMGGPPRIPWHKRTSYLISLTPSSSKI